MSELEVYSFYNGLGKHVSGTVSSLEDALFTAQRKAYDDQETLHVYSITPEKQDYLFTVDHERV